MAEPHRSNQPRFAAALVRASLSGLASAAAERILSHELRPVTGGDTAFGQWRATAESQLEYLAAALAADRSAIFEDHVQWSKWVCAARGVPVEDLREALRSIGKVVRGELPAQAGELAEQWVSHVLGRFDELSGEPPSHLVGSSPHGKRATQYLFQLLSGDRDGAVRLIDEIREEGVTIPEIYTQVLSPALAEIGRLWVLGEAHVAEEHFATATSSLVISRLYPHLPRRPENGKTVMTVSAEGELHELGIRMIADFFTMDGWRVIHLGAGLPAADLMQGVVDFSADLVALSVSLPTHLDRAEKIIAEIRKDDRTAKVPVLVGGRAFQGNGDLWEALGADGWAQGLAEAVEVGRRLVGLAPTAE